MQIECRLVRWDRLRTNAGTGASWAIYWCRDLKHNTEIKAVGTMADSVRKKGVRLILDGTWGDDKYSYPGAKQFNFRNHIIMRPAGKEGMIAFLETASHIGKVKAGQIWRQFGEESARLIIQDHEILVTKRILNREQSMEAASDLACGIDEAKFYSALNTLFSGMSFPKSLPKTIIKKRWGDPVGVIEKNPFRVLEFRGVGFKKCDTLRRKLGLPDDMPERLRAAVEFVIESHPSDTWLPHKATMCDIAEALTVTNARAREILDDAIENRGVTCVTEKGVKWVCKTAYGTNEYQMCEHLVRLIAGGNCTLTPDVVPTWPELSTEDGLSKHQVVELHNAFSNGRVAVLMGNAGSGKTYTAGKVINVLRKRGKRVLVCAPTGKAAVRIEQSLRDAGVHNLMAATVHRTLKARVTAEGGFSFAVDGESMFLDADLIVVDEMSMMTNHLLLCLLKAIRTGTHILFLGDPNQLAPVGRGTFLRDWQLWCDGSAEKSTYGKLTEIQRHAGGIIRTSKAICDGTSPELFTTSNPGQRWTLETNLQYKRCQEDMDIQTAMLDVIDDICDGKIGLHNGELHPTKDVQVIVATNSGSPCSKDEVNELLQKKLNGHAPGDHEIFKVGDKVICLKNNTVGPDTRTNPTGGEYFLANGSLGYVTRSETKRIYVRMDDYPNIELIIPLGSGRGDFDLAYAITCHKMQGSQAPVVITLLGGGSAMMVSDRGWFYTAITRAEHLSIVLSNGQNVTRACRRTHVHDRKSFTTRWLKHHMK